MSSALIRQHSEAAREPAWLTEARIAAYEAHLKLPPPVWPRTPAAKVDLGLAAPAAASGGTDAVAKAPRVDGLTVLDLRTAARERPELVKDALASVVGPSEGKWEALHAALWNGGTFVHVARKVEVEEPIVIDVVAGADGRLGHTLVVAEPLSKVSIVERLRSAPGQVAKPSLVTAGVEILARDGAKVHYANVQDLGAHVTHLAAKRALVSRDAHVAWVDAQFGGAVTRGTLETILGGPGGSCLTVAAFFGDGKQHFDVSTTSLHRARATSSQITAKGVLLGEAYSSYAGLVSIGHEAPGSSGHLTENTLLMSDKARADAIPKLDVENNEVQASHGATVGQVDPDQLFYIQSRGLGEKIARRLLVEGFFEPLLQEIPNEDVRDELAATITRRMS